VISDNQFGFIKGRYILDGAVALHEIVHEVKKKKTRCDHFENRFRKGV
jgi:hypothetical protein